jgi:hypothetical protein
VAAPSHLARWVAALALGFVAGCSGGTVPSPAEAAADAGQTAAATVPFLSLLTGAPTKVAHSGVRRFESHGIDGAPGQKLEYTESVHSDGLGKVSVTPLTVLAPPMSDAEKSVFLMTQKLRQRTMYFARDFAVRDPDLFAQNYTLVDTGFSQLVAGVSCVRMLVTKRVAPDRRYVIDVDTTNGLVLRSREELLDGTLITLVTYESIDYTPDLSGVAWSAPINGELDLVPGTAEALSHLGFVPRTPKVLPAGWEEIGFAKIVDPTTGQVWARLTYSDGVELIYFVVAKGDGPGHQLKNPPPGTPPSHADRVRKLAVGAWTLLEADLSHGRALVLGRAPDGTLEGLIQSAFF